METRRCPNCHKLQRASAQQCSRCGQSLARKRAQDVPAPVSQPSLPIASPHRVGHYFGLHPEDQPYQSNKIVTQRPHSDDFDELFTRERQEPTHIVLPSTDSAPALKRYREALHPPRVVSESRGTRRSRKTTPLPLEASPRTPRPVSTPRVRLSLFGISRRTISLVLMVSCVIFLLAASIVTLGHLNANRSGQSPVLTALPGTVRVNDVFTLKGEKWAPHDAVTLMYENETPLVGENHQPLRVQSNERGMFQVRVLALPAWSVGQHTLSALDQKQKLTFATTIMVQAAPASPPDLNLATSSVDLGAEAAGVVSEQSVALSNRGGGQVAWQASSDQPWLTLSPSSGTFAGQTTVQIAGNRGSLAPGAYTGHIQFAQPARSQPALTLTVTMAVSPEPARLAVSSTALAYSAPAQQNPADQRITIRNDGGESMAWSVTATTDDGAPWLALTPAQGALAPGTQTVLTVHITSRSLPVGSYSGLLTFSGDASARVLVTLTVIAPGNLVISPPVLTVSAPAGQSASTSLLALQNSGPLALDWSVTATTQNTGDWLTVTPDHGSLDVNAHATVQVGATAAALTPGTYQGLLTFKAGTQTKTISLSFTVTPPPTTTSAPAPFIEVQPAVLQITTVKGQPPATLEVNVTNSGQAVLHWNAQVDNQASPYIQVVPAQGSLDPGQSGKVKLTVNVAQASPGEMVAMITIVDADGQKTVASRSVELDVTVQAVT